MQLCEIGKKPVLSTYNVHSKSQQQQRIGTNMRQKTANEEEEK